MAVEIRNESSESGRERLVRTTRRQDLVTALLGTWLTIGGFVDGYAHRNLDTPETFFTPWHGVLYSGYLALAAWVLWLVVRNRETTPSIKASIPDGYANSVVGVVVFAVGGVGDAVWHTLFGIEVSVDALLSPTHLLLLVGALLMISGPLLASWRNGEYHPDRIREFWPPLLAVSMAAAELGFFFQYIDGLSSRLMQVPYLPQSDEGFFELAVGITSILITTIILMGAVLLMMRRWDLPLGSGLVLFGLFAVLMETLEGFDFPEDIIAPLAAGLAADLLIRYLGPEPGRVAVVRALAFLVPVVMWSVRFVVFERFSDINWPTSVWTGTIVLSGLAAVGLSLLAFPPSRPEHGSVGAAA